MIVDLVRTKTDDDVRLDGILQSPASEGSTPSEWVVVCLHGVGGNFYGSTLFDDIAAPFLDRGIHVLRVNTRGHDGFSFATGKRRRQGAAFEIVDECRLDLAAWLSFLSQERGFKNIILAGHSLGAIKAVYATAMDALPIAAVLAMSPPRLSNVAFQNGEQSAEFFGDMAEAERLYQAGRPDTLLAARVPFPILISAACYIDKYGPKETYNILRYIERLACPTLFTYGQLELEKGGIAFAGLPEAIGARHLPEQQVEVRSIGDADHMYSGVRPALAECISDWLEFTLRLPSPA